MVQKGGMKMKNKNTITTKYMIKMVTDAMQTCSYDMLVAIYLFALTISE